MARAARDLARTDHSVAQVGEGVGYQSVPAFTRAFRRHHGTTPAAYDAPPERRPDDRRDPMHVLLLTLTLAADPAEPAPMPPVVLSETSTRMPPPRGVPWFPYSADGAPLDTSAFYEALGRDEELRRHQRRQRNRWVASAAAIGVSTVGGALASAYVLPEITDNGGAAAAGAAAGVWVVAHLPAVAVVPLLLTNSRRGRYPALRHDRSEAEAWIQQAESSRAAY